MLPKDKLPTEPHLNPYVGVWDNLYNYIILKLWDIGMVHIRDVEPLDIKEIFFVPKDECKQRLIIDARNANRLIFQSTYPKLPNSVHLSELYLSKVDKLYVPKSDLDNYHHRLRLPSWARKLPGHPVSWKVSVRDGLYCYPCLWDILILYLSLKKFNYA